MNNNPNSREREREQKWGSEIYFRILCVFVLFLNFCGWIAFYSFSKLSGDEKKKFRLFNDLYEVAGGEFIGFTIIFFGLNIIFWSFVSMLILLLVKLSKKIKSNFSKSNYIR